MIAISPDSFNLGPVSDNSGICFAGAASVPALNDSKVARRFSCGQR